MNPASSPTRAAVPALFGLVVLALALRMPGYLRSVWIDELYTSNLFVGDFVVLLKTLYSDIHPPLYFVFIHAWNRLFGDAELWLRLPPLLSGLASVVVIYRVGRDWISHAAGLVAAFLLAVSPVHIWYSQEARPYATNVLLLLLSVLAFTRLVQGRTSRWWFWAHLGALAGIVFTHYYMATFLFAYPALAFLTRAPNRARLTIASVVVLALLAVYMGAKVYFSHVPTSKDYLRPFDLVAAWNLFFNWFLTGNSLTPRDHATMLGLVLRGVLQVVAVLTIVRGLRRLVNGTTERPHAWLLAALMLVLPAFLFLLPLAGKPQTYIERSALPSLPLFYLVLAAGCTGWMRPRVWRGALVSVGVASVVVLCGFFLNAERWTVYKPHPDWRNCADWLSSEVDGAEGRRVLYTDYPSATPLTYYDARLQERKNFERNTGKLDKLVAATARVFGTEGFPGGIIQRFVQARFAEFEAKLKRAEAATRLEIRRLRPEQALATGARPFYLLEHGTPCILVQRIVRDPATTVLAKRSFPMLTVYKVRRE